MQHQADKIWLGALFMCLAMLAGSIIDITVKLLSDTYDTPQIVLLRTLFALPLVLLICHFQSGLGSLATPRWGWQTYRSLLAAGANFGFFYALAHLPLVTAVLLAYVSPVLIVLLAKPLLGESVSLNRWVGIIIAAIGVVVVLQPKSIELHPAVWALFGSSLCWALLSLSNRRLAGIESPAVLTFFTIPSSALIAFVLTLGEWQSPTLIEWLLFALAGFSGGVAHLLVAYAYKHAPAAVIAPFEYTALIWTALAGYLFWGEIPTKWILIGGIAVIVGGYLSLQNPRLLRKTAG